MAMFVEAAQQSMYIASDGQRRFPRFDGSRDMPTRGLERSMFISQSVDFGAEPRRLFGDRCQNPVRPFRFFGVLVERGDQNAEFATQAAASKCTRGNRRANRIPHG